MAPFFHCFIIADTFSSYNHSSVYVCAHWYVRSSPDRTQMQGQGCCWYLHSSSIHDITQGPGWSKGNGNKCLQWDQGKPETMGQRKLVGEITDTSQAEDPELSSKLLKVWGRCVTWIRWFLQEHSQRSQATTGRQVKHTKVLNEERRII